MTTEQMDWLDDEHSGRHAAVNPPSRELDSAIVNGGRTVPNAAKRIKERNKAQAKADKKRAKAERAMRDAEFTPAQRIMRDEMGKGAHRGLDMQDPTQLGAVLDDTFGPQSAGDHATEAVHDIINDYQGQISTGFKEWAAIQSMMEDAYRKGYGDGHTAGYNQSLGEMDSYEPRADGLQG